MLAQRRREVHGFHYDPLPEDDVKWAEEFSSDDCDSSDQHDVAYGDSTSDGTTTEDETTGRYIVKFNHLDECSDIKSRICLLFRR